MLNFRLSLCINFFCWRIIASYFFLMLANWFLFSVKLATFTQLVLFFLTPRFASVVAYIIFQKIKFLIFGDMYFFQIDPVNDRENFVRFVSMDILSLM